MKKQHVLIFTKKMGTAFARKQFSENENFTVVMVEMYH